MEKHLSIAVLNTLKHDNDPFVRSKALECLEEMVSVLDIWETSLKKSDLIVSVHSKLQFIIYFLLSNDCLCNLDTLFKLNAI